MKDESLMVGRSPSVITRHSKADENVGLQSLWQWMGAWFKPNHELKVWQEHDFRGNLFWCAYDPLTNQEVAFPTDEQLRQWIENPVPRCLEVLDSGFDD
ncbi:hypothetical protein H6G89_06975 [Oscillatoria sp. FACHB-1407]|uniref:hypothetical protein n=1 Tax=Oscillatoria sp. FACHB-1407 TaxID=2692847 RepID=UPI0016882AE0|nr:hypothetical protein [Oscillatoria sp. FACHB-1407]MBD2460784.1 hypothetical protein [Oscillatoria sp. FACHB-1407]